MGWISICNGSMKLPLCSPPQILGLNCYEASQHGARVSPEEVQMHGCGYGVGGELGLTRAGFCQVSATYLEWARELRSVCLEPAPQMSP